MKSLIKRFAIMVLAVFPVVSLLGAAAFYYYPGETVGFVELWNIAVDMLLFGPGILALALVLAHRPGTQIVDRRWRWKPLGESIFVGAILGAILGGVWALLFFWGIGVPVLGSVAGALYGFVVWLPGRGKLLELKGSGGDDSGLRNYA